MANFENWNKKLSLNEIIIESNGTNEPIIMQTAKDQKFNNPYNYKVITSDGIGGGAVVLFSQDIAFHILVDHSIIKDIMTDFVKMLQSHNINAKIENNDITINGCKILGSTSVQYKEKGYLEGFFISFYGDPNIINAISIKPKQKLPAPASAFGITPEHIRKFLGFIKCKYNLTEVEE